MSLLEARIDLDAIAANTRTLRGIAAPAKLLCMVKADGYAHGAAEVAQVMAANGADQFGVATIDEALALRASGIQQPIMCWLWEPEDDVAGCLDAGITLGVASKSQAEQAIAHGRGRVVIKVDTGMRRSGLVEAHWEPVMRMLAASPLEVTGVMSHLACADDLSSDVTPSQLAAFDRAIATGRRLGLALPCNHIANSPAALHWPEAKYDMVRTGVVLYGQEPIAGSAHGLREAMQWVSTVTVVKPIAAGEASSYGHTWQAPEDGHIAIVAVGYADGLPRNAQGHLEVTINGKRYPQVGRVCMDQIVVFLGKDAEVAPGDKAILFGPGGMSAGDLAQAMGTINYEVVCWPKGRTARVYHQKNRGAGMSQAAYPTTRAELQRGSQVCDTAAQTQALAGAIGALLRHGDVVILTGPLGAGKTTFTQGLARGLDVAGRVTSPTFQIAREHHPNGDGPTLVHVDAYRLLEAGEDPLDALESLDLMTELEHAVVVAEWGGGMMEQLADRYLAITIDRTTAVAHDPDSETRIISWQLHER